MSTRTMQRQGLSPAGLFHLMVIYFVWGSTYLGIRVAVREGAGFTPFMMGAMRALLAGVVLLTVSALSRQRLRLGRAEIFTLIGLGALFWVGGNGLVMLAERRADSSLAALIMAAVPVWVAIIDGVLDRRPPSLLLIGSLIVATSGLVILLMPLILSGLRADLISVVALVVASFSWAGGTVLQSRRRTDLAPTVNSGYQMLFGGIGFALVALLLREPLPQPTTAAWLAYGYLVVFGSILAFTSFLQALKLLPSTLVTTTQYVNPIIAVFLGWAILAEQVTGWTILASALVLIGVAGVFRDHLRR